MKHLGTGITCDPSLATFPPTEMTTQLLLGWGQGKAGIMKQIR